jgi:4a-hydroxytetrahydrobiopterin dehydratase
MEALSNNEVKKLLSLKLRNWSFDENHLHRDLKFDTFIEAFSFMTAVAIEAEKMDHHPDWSNVYNRVFIKLGTHDAKGVTQMDFDLAQTIDKLFEKYELII